MGKYIDLDTGVPAIWSQVKSSLSRKVDSAYVQDGVAHFTSDGTELFTITGIGGGGGSGGGGNTAEIRMSNASGWLSKTIAEGTECIISVSWSSTFDNEPTGNGKMTVVVNGSSRLIKDVAQGTVSFNAGEYLEPGSNIVKVTITDAYDNERTINYTVNIVSLVLRSSFNASTPKEGQFVFQYIPIGNVEKTIYFILDGEIIGTEITPISGRQQSFMIPAQTHGSHSLRVYFEATINEEVVRSNELYYDIICVESGNTRPVIASTFRTTTTEQYSTLLISYTVYNPQSLTTPVTLSANGEIVNSITVDRSEQKWSYRADVPGPLTLAITAGKTTKTFELSVSESSVNFGIVTEDLVLSLSSYGRSNSEPNPEVWNDGDIYCELTGFNFASDGWVHDDDGNVVLRVSGDARVNIPYQPFRSSCPETGKTIEIDFATRDVMNYDSVILSSMDEGIGLEITANLAKLTSSQSIMKAQYKEDEHIRLTFVVEKDEKETTTEGSVEHSDRLFYVYLNGVMCGVIQYSVNDDFSQLHPQNITIGSNYCTIDIYSIRIYDHDLTRNQILDNWISDTQDIGQMLDRYSRNNIYNEYGSIVIPKLPNYLPYMIVSCPELPQYKGDKKTVTVDYIDPLNDDKCFEASGVQINVQGTSSAPYPRKNYDLQFKKGFEINGEHEDNYALKSNVVPFNRFVIKADVASSEGANNVELVRLYCDACPFKTREMLADSRVRQGIDGFPIVLFWNDTANNTTQFMGKYNFNLPKRAPGPYGYSGDMQSWEFENNTSNLMLFKTDYFDETQYYDQEAQEYRPIWRQDFEARFPSDALLDHTMIGELVSFVVSTDRDKATNATLSNSVTYDGVEYTKDTADYRLAKFKAEFPSYAELDSFLFYYIFTEFFLMVDSRAKNLFIGFSGSDVTATGRIATRKAVAEPYDMDTAIGTNNEAAIVFDYAYEDTDTLEGGDVFNGQHSVLWNNIRDAYYSEIGTMYQNLRSAGVLTLENVEQRFEDHQRIWSEAIFNEDSYFKYLAPLISPDPGKDPTPGYLHMLQGSKKEQRIWWLYNRFKYMDSKFNSGDALADVIQLRGYAKDNITVTPYADIYISIKYGSYLVQQRAKRNNAYTIPCPVDTLNDTEIYLYSASQLSSIGDLSGLKPGFADFSKARRLSSLKVGDASPSYTNPNLKTLYVGTNDLLQTIDVRNCNALGTDEQTTVDLSGAKNIENVYFDGTAIKGCVLPNGGILKVLHLPATVTNLTIQNQKGITEFVMPSYSNISALRLENVGSSFPTRTILSGLRAGSRVRLTGFNWECADVAEIESILDILDQMRGIGDNGSNLDHACDSVSGTIHVPVLTGDEIETFRARGYKYITFTADDLTAKLTYKTFNGATVIATETIRNGGDGTRKNTQSRTSTNQYDYRPDAWSLEPDGETDDDALLGVTENRTVYASYIRILRTYTVTWKNTDGSILEVDVNVPYGTIPTYDGPIPSYGGETASGWTTEIVEVTGDTTYTASYLPVYTVNFYNGTTLLQSVKVNKGDDAHYTGELPTSPDGDFLGWDPEPVNVVENMNCYPVFNFGMDEPDLKYLNYSMNDTDMTITISGLNVENIINDNLTLLTIPDTIQGHKVIIT